MLDVSVGSGDCLVMMFPLLAKLHERGATLPFCFPETVCYEHHFPRGWYYFEREQAKKARAAAGEGGSSAGTPATASNANAESLLEQLRASSPFLGHTVTEKALNNPQQQHASEQPKLQLLKKTVKECDSGAIRRTFANAPTSKSPIGSEVVSRTASGSLEVRFLNSALLADFLMNTPETCVLSKNVASTSQRNDVVVAAWTPTVFSIEHRVNHHLLSDESVPLQARGDTYAISNYKEVQCCPLLATRIREAMQQLVWIVAKYERKTVVEFRANFRPDSRPNSTVKYLWFLWADSFRVADHSRPAASLTVPPVGTVGGSGFWDQLEQEEQRKKRAASLVQNGRKKKVSEPGKEGESENSCSPQRTREVSIFSKDEFSPAFLSGGSQSSASPKRSSTAPLEKRPARRGVWPSFTPADDEVDSSVVDKVTTKMDAILAAANRMSKPSDSESKHRNKHLPKIGKSHPPPLAEAGAPSRVGGCALEPMIPLCLLALANEDELVGCETEESTRQTAPIQRKSIVDDVALSPAGSDRDDDDEIQTKSSSHGGGKKSKVIAYRAPAVAAKPSIWRRKLMMIEARQGKRRIATDTPRMRPDEHERQSLSVRSVSLSQQSLAELQSCRSELSRWYGDRVDDEAKVRELASVAGRRASIRDRPRVSVVSFGNRDVEHLDIDSRLRFADLRRRHAAVLDQLADTKYMCHSEEMRSRGPTPIFFDLPKNCPKISTKIIKRIGISVTAENPELDATAIEEFYIVPHQGDVNILWAFDVLSDKVRAACNAVETHFLAGD